MHPNAIYTFAQWQVKEGHLPAVLNLLPELVSKSSAEEGNLFYKIYQSRSDSQLLILAEGYRDAAALDAHRSAEHFNNIVVQQIIPHLEKRSVELANELVL